MHYKYFVLFIHWYKFLSVKKVWKHFLKSPQNGRNLQISHFSSNNFLLFVCFFFFLPISCFLLYFSISLTYFIVWTEPQPLDWPQNKPSPAKPSPLKSLAIGRHKGDRHILRETVIFIFIFINFLIKMRVRIKNSLSYKSKFIFSSFYFHSTINRNGNKNIHSWVPNNPLIHSHSHSHSYPNLQCINNLIPMWHAGAWWMSLSMRDCSFQCF